MSFFSSAFRPTSGRFRVQVKQIECDQHDLIRFVLQFVLQSGKVGAAVGRRYHYLAVENRGSSGNVPGVVSDLFESIGPVVAAACQNFQGLIGEMHLHPVAVELDFVNPALT